MNILIIPSWFVTKENPISGIFFKEQACSLNSYFNRFLPYNKVFVLAIEQVSILTPWNYVKTIFRKRELTLKEENGIPTGRIQFIKIPKLNALNYNRGGKNLSRRIDEMQERLKVHFDLVHIHSAFDAGIWYVYSKKSIPYIITEHQSKYAEKTVARSEKRVLPNLYENAARIIAVGNGLARYINEYINDKKIEVIFNQVSFPISKRIRPQNKEFTFLAIGCDAWVKGFDILLASFNMFISQGNEGHLIIAGLSQKEKKWLLSMGFPSETMNRVNLLGVLSREDVFAYMNQCNCFSMVSRFETFGIVFAEAMYCGKPVIASRTGGPDSYINETNGILVPVCDIEETALALIKMKSDYRKYDAHEIQRYAEANFSPDIVCKKIAAIYTSVLS